MEKNIPLQCPQATNSTVHKISPDILSSKIAALDFHEALQAHDIHLFVTVFKY